MSSTEQYRAKSNEYDELSKESRDPGQIRRYQDSSDSFGSLADNEEWLRNNPNMTLQASDQAPPEEAPDENKSSHVTLAAEEERVLRCLGAAVIMHWNTIATKLQRELFDTAGSMGELLATAELRAQIARFLHKHKDADAKAGHPFELKLPNPDRGLSCDPT
jgi:hypothetical protein